MVLTGTIFLLMCMFPVLVMFCADAEAGPLCCVDSQVTDITIYLSHFGSLLNCLSLGI